MAKVSEKLFHDHFGKAVYWEEKYADKRNQFEWYHPYKMIKDVITQYIKDIKGSRVLNVGCGTSRLPEDMYNDGFRNIISIDESQDCVDEMRASFNNTMPSTFLFLKMDCLRMDFGDDIFNVIVDKGTLDSIASGFRSTENIRKYLKEVDRVMLKPGVFFCLSHREPEEREYYFHERGWTVYMHKIYRPKFQSELRFIKQQYISKDVVKGIEKEKEIEIDPKMFGEEFMEIAEKVIQREANQRQKEREDVEALKPRDVDCYYLYVCAKGKFDSQRHLVDDTNLILAEANEYQIDEPQVEQEDEGPGVKESESQYLEEEGEIEEYGHDVEGGSVSVQEEY